ncbi:MAG: PrsW family intramembrane metalloprotease, partial [Oscillospiraceae bacterium]|nr:PrsW family intramembrane metalloprotease [Oscillospiraceae bacterium]
MNFLVVAALVPAVILMWYIWKKDKVEKEPTKVILKVVGAGGLTVISAIILEFIGDLIAKSVIGMDETSIAYGLVFNFLVVAFSEELGKLVALRLSTWKSGDFNYTYDAVVYAVAASLGFAAVENVLYVLMGGFGVAVVRAFTAVPGHAIDGVFMGYYYGMARQAWGRGNKGEEVKNMILAFIVPVILHGIYDFCLFEYAPDGMIVIFFIYLVLTFFLAVIRINKLSAMDTPILGTGVDFPDEMKNKAPEGIPNGAAPVNNGLPYPSYSSQMPQYAQPQTYAQPVNTPQYGGPHTYTQPANTPQYGGQQTYAQPANTPQYGGQQTYAQPANTPQYSGQQTYAQPVNTPQYSGQQTYAQPANTPQYSGQQTYA